MRSITNPRFWLLGLSLGAMMVASPSFAAKTLVYCTDASPTGFTAALVTTKTSMDAARPVYDQLVLFKRGETTVVPGLATKWVITNGGKTITFTLRKGVKFHSGVNGFTPTRDFNADDVLWSFNRMWRDDHPYHKVSGGTYDYFSDMSMNELLKSITKVDDYTVRFELTEGNVTMIPNLAMDFATIYSAEYADYLLKQGKLEQFDQIPVGTGPFVFQSYQKDSVIRYRANPGYWGEKAKVDNLVFAITPEETQRLTKLKANECQFFDKPRPNDLAEIKSNPNLKLIGMPSLSTSYFSFQVNKPPLTDKRVRQALSLAIDRKSLIDQVYLGAALPAANFITPDMMGYNKKIIPYDYNPEKAKKLLLEAGVQTPLTVEFWWPPNRSINKTIAERVQADWAKIGVEAKLVSFEWGEYVKRVNAGEHQVAMMTWGGDNGDPDNFFQTIGCSKDLKPSPSNMSKWCQKEFDQLFHQAKVMVKPSDRVKAYERMQVILHEEQPQFLNVHRVDYKAMRKEVVGFKQSPFDRDEFQGVDLQP